MSKHTFLVFVIFVVLFTTCNSDRTKSISLTTSDGYTVYNMYGDTMVFMSPYKNKILFWNVKTNDTFSINLNLNFRIEDAFLSGVYFYVFDNRLFINTNNYRIYKYNLDTKLFDDTLVFSHVIDKNTEFIIDPVGSECPMYIKENNVYLHCSPNILSNIKDKNIMKYFSYSNTLLIKDSVKIFFGEYPSSYLSNYYYDNYPMYLAYSDTLVCCFRTTPICYRYVKGLFVDSVHTLSKYFNSYLPFSYKEWIAGNISDSVIQASELLNPLFYKMLYNYKTHTFYRIVYHSNNSEGKIATSFEDKSWSLLKMDAKFNALSEEIFNQKKYNPSNLFPFDKGIIIQLNENKIYDKKITYTFEYIEE